MIPEWLECIWCILQYDNDSDRIPNFAINWDMNKLLAGERHANVAFKSRMDNVFRLFIAPREEA